MDPTLLERLHADGALSETAYQKIKGSRQNELISLHWEIKTLLYLGVLLLCGGLGILIYKNINTIGHQVILLFIALVCTGSLFYCFKNKLPFSAGKVPAPNSFFDYVLLLGCSTFIIFIAYLQYQYNLFGNRYGLASFFPMALLFFCAYYFDHLGILSMGIANLAAWLGITVTPMQVLVANDFNSGTVICTGLALGGLLIFIAWATRIKNIKRHFEFTYANFGTHLLLICCLAAMFHFNTFYMAWFILLIAASVLFYGKALKDQSFYFILVITLYDYIGISYAVVELLNWNNMGTVYLGFFYFIISAIGLILFLISTNKKIKAI